MVSVGAYEAKSKLPDLLKKVMKGEYFIITKHTGYLPVSSSTRLRPIILEATSYPDT